MKYKHVSANNCVKYDILYYSINLDIQPYITHIAKICLFKIKFLAQNSPEQTQVTKIFEFSLNVFNEFSDNFFSKIKRIAVLEPRALA